MDIAELMRERPDSWGLRGDPHLWDEMERTLEAVPLPEDRSALERLLQRCFEKHAGISLAFEGEHFVPRFDTGGMSSGQVLPAFWQTVPHANPIFYIVDGFRYGFLRISDTPLWLSAGVLVAVCAILGLIAWHEIRSGLRLKQ